MIQDNCHRVCPTRIDRGATYFRNGSGNRNHTEHDITQPLGADDRTVGDMTDREELSVIARDTTTEMFLEADDSDDSSTEMLKADEKLDNNFEYRRSLSYSQAVSVHNDKDHLPKAGLLSKEI